MILRQSQLRALGAQRQASFKDRLLAHVRTHFPGEIHGLDELSLCRQALDRARGHGFSTEQDLSKYVNLVLVFGLDFDVDPAHGWARKILGNREIGSTLKINRLYLEALKHEQEKP